MRFIANELRIPAPMRHAHAAANKHLGLLQYCRTRAFVATLPARIVAQFQVVSLGMPELTADVDLPRVEPPEPCGVCRVAGKEPHVHRRRHEAGLVPMALNGARECGEREGRPPAGRRVADDVVLRVGNVEAGGRRVSR